MNSGNPALHRRIVTPQQRYRMPSGAKQLILVRHGSTDLENAERIVLDGLDISNPVLLPEGHEQAQAVARRLSAEPVSAIFVTPLHRTHQTAEPLAALTGLGLTVIPELREVHMGDWEHGFHVHATSGNELLGRMFAEETWDVVPNAEPMAAVSARVRAGIQRVAEILAPDSSGVIFAHGGTIAEICRQAARSSPFAFFGPDNTSISRIIVHGDGHWTLRCFNDVAHL